MYKMSIMSLSISIKEIAPLLFLGIPWPVQKSPGILPTQHSKIKTLFIPASLSSHVSKLHHFFGMSKNFPTPLLVSLTQFSLIYVTIPSELHPSFLSMYDQESPFLSQRYTTCHSTCLAHSRNNLQCKNCDIYIGWNFVILAMPSTDLLGPKAGRSYMGPLIIKWHKINDKYMCISNNWNIV